MAAPTDGAFFFIYTASIILLCTPTEMPPQDTLFINLNRLPGDALVVNTGTLGAECTATTVGLPTFEWATGEGVCSNSTSSNDTIFPSSTVKPNEGHHVSLLLVSMSGLHPILYHYVKCIATLGTTRTVVCQQFRTFKYYPEPDGGAVAIGSKVRLGCGTAELPMDVAVNVTWGSMLSQTRSPPLNGWQLSYNVTGEMFIDPSAGMEYHCLVTSTGYFTLFEAYIDYLTDPLAVVKDFAVGVDASNNQMVVNITCEGYGNPQPTVALLIGEYVYPMNGTTSYIVGGISQSYSIYVASNDVLEPSSYGCRAQSQRGTSVVYYNASATEATLSSASLPEGSAAVIFFGAVFLWLFNI